MSKARWLFPADRPAVRRAGITGLFRPSSLKGRVLRGLILTGGMPGEKTFLENDPMDRLEAELARALGAEEVRVAFYLGVPGAYRKITAQVMTPDGVTLAFAKIAASRATRRLIEDEHRILLRLSGSEGLRGRVPEALRLFDWQGSKTLLITSGPVQRGPRRLTSAHVDLCKRIFLPFVQRTAFGESPMMTRMSRQLREVGPHLSGPLHARLDEALGQLRHELGDAVLPLSLSHRDFAPWNTRSGPSGLFVFDWDGAQDGTTPLYDLFHFQAIQAALFGRRDHLPDRSLLHETLAGLWPEGRAYLSLLYLAYLLDMSLFYGQARVIAPDVGEDRVWNWFCEQVGAFLEKGPPF